VVATPTASGKTLCYNLPVLDAVLSQGRKALYLFPTKALAQDQAAELMALSRAIQAAGGPGVKAFTFDGDTPGDARKAVRTRGDIVLSNPDMLHQAILPHHTKWAQFFEGLAYIVVDELHTYRGVFGSHVANVFRRLRAGLSFLWRGADLHLRLGDHRQSGRAGRASLRRAGRGHHRVRRAAGRASSPALESAGHQPGSRHPRLGPLPDHAHRAHGGQAGAQEHRLRPLAPDGRGHHQVSEGCLRSRPAQARRASWPIAAVICRASGAVPSRRCAPVPWIWW
jgi:hypothetical protein